mmetsp:Transcript_2154/g.5459  ORF Transcript_2154/g.5459 Transcript_2154/m.5459 type:complete len:445 (+) Transcript_2154:34-1368(+)
MEGPSVRPSSSETEVQATEVTPLCKSNANEHADVWTWRDTRLFAGLIAWIMASIGVVYAWGPLLAAFEADEHMSWTAQHTAIMSTVGGVLEASGIGLAGPIADYLQAERVVAFLSVFSSLSVLVCSILTAPWHIIMLLCLVGFCKGLLWPTISAIVGANLHEGKHDYIFALCALSSRSGDVLSASLLGAFMKQAGDSWRHALQKYIALCIALFIAVILIVPKDLAAPGDSQFSVRGLTGKIPALLRNFNAWLTFGCLCGTYTVWSLVVYTNVFLVDLYNIHPGSAATYTAAMPFGSTLGLVTVLITRATLGRNYGRTAQVLQTLVGVGFAVALAISRPSLNATLIGYAMIGWAFSAAAYLPLMIFGASSEAQSRAFNISVLDCTASLLFMSGTNYAIGRYRTVASDPWQVAVTMYSWNALGLLGSALSMGWLYLRIADNDISGK